MARAAKPKKEISMEEALWKSADKLRGSVEPAEYKHVVLSLFFLKFASDKFEEYARYKSTGSATEFFNWEDMCAVPFEIPPMDFQQLVVNAYKVLNERIETKQKINDNLAA